MQKDLKIGLLLGLAVVSVAVLWLATRPSLSPQARMLADHGAVTGPGSPEGITAGEHNNLNTSEVKMSGNDLLVNFRLRVVKMHSRLLCVLFR